MPGELARRIENALWRDRGALPAPARAGIVLLRYVYALLRDGLTGNLTLHATGLVYVTILSLVPLLAVSFSVLKAFGFQRQLEPLLYDLFAPLGDSGAEITRRILGFVDNVQGDVLAGIGLLVLFFTAISMAEKVEGGFNYVWRVERPRSLARRVTEYLSVILVGPVVMVTAMTLIARLSHVRMLRRVGAAAFQDGGLLDSIAPYALVCIAFTFVYAFVPNTRVKPAAAAVGGLCGGVLWAATGALFATWVVESTRSLSIYAGFAVVVVALVWLYLCWLILLIGAQVSYYVQHPECLHLGYRPLVTGTGEQEEMALGVMLAVGTAFAPGGGALRIADVSQATGVPGIVLAPVVLRLEAAGLLARADDDRLLPARDPGTILLRDVVAAVRDPHGSDVRAAATWPDGLNRLRAQLEGAVAGTLAQRTLADLVREDDIP